MEIIKIGLEVIWCVLQWPYHKILATPVLASEKI